MLDGLNGMLKKVSSLNDQIEKIKSMPQKVEQGAKQEIKDSLPFSAILSQKRTQPDTDLGELIDRVSDNEGVDKDLVRSVIQTESNFNHNARSQDGAIGLMQLMPETADELGVDPENPSQNVKGGVKYLGNMMDRYDNLEDALAAYNAGPEAVDRHGGVPPFDETQEYVKKVLSNFRQLKQSGTQR